MSHFLDRQGRPLADVYAWARLVEDRDYCRVDRTEIRDPVVSAVWLGTDMSFGLGGPPLIFETAIFGPGDGENRELTELIRTPTEAAAIAAHDQAVAHVRATVKALGWAAWTTNP